MARRRGALPDDSQLLADGDVRPARGAGAERRLARAGRIHRRARRPIRGALSRRGRRGVSFESDRHGGAARLGPLGSFARRRRAAAGGREQPFRRRFRCRGGTGVRADQRHAAGGREPRARCARDRRGDLLRGGGRDRMRVSRPIAAMRIAVLGGGHGAYAAAADLSEQGHEVRFWRRDATALRSLQESGAITLIDAAGTRRVRIAKVAADPGAAVAGAKLIVVAAPATAQEDIARAMAPHLVPGQVVFLPPGTFGSYVMGRIAHASGSRAAFAEAGTLPYLARKRG